MMERFITNCEFKTPSMKVKVFDENLVFKKEYVVSPGFQLECYVMSLHPKSSLSIRFLDSDEESSFCVDVYEGDNFIERHLGKYETKIL